MPKNITDPHGIDITAEGGIDQLLDFHRGTFGDAVMEEGAGEGGEGGSGEGGDSTEKPDGGEGDGKQEKPSGDTTTEPESKETETNPWTDPDKAKAEIERLRRQSGDERINAKNKAADDARNELIQKIGRELGLVDDGKKATPEQLTQQLAEQQNEANSAKLELAVYKNAGDGDPDALLDSKKFQEHIKDVDHSDEKKLKAEISKFITDNPKFKAARAAGQTGADRTGGAGEKRKQPASTLEGAIGGHYGT